MDDYYKVTEIYPGVYRITSREMCYMELLTGSDAALLFDTGYGYGNLKETVRTLTDLPLYVVNSHGHLDHTCGNYQFGYSADNVAGQDLIYGCYMHPKDFSVYEKYNTPGSRAENVERAKSSYDYIANKLEDILPDNFREEVYVNAQIPEAKPVREGTIFDLGGITLEVFELPGHTAGSIGLLWHEQKIFYVGDAITSFVWLFFPESLKLDRYMKTLRKADQIDFEKMAMSHSPELADKSMLKVYLETAGKVEFEHGIPFQTPLVPDREIRICTRDGFGAYEFTKPGFASIAISREKL